MRRRVGGWLAALAITSVLVFAGGNALACAICLSAVKITPADRLDDADAAVIAVPAAEGGWRIVSQLKGDTPASPTDLEAAGAASAPPASGQGVLLVRDRLGQRWSQLAAVPLDEADFLRAFAVSARPGAAEQEAAPWRERLEMVASRLAHPSPFIASLAHGVVAKAPYGAFPLLAPHFHPDWLRAHLEAEADPSRRAAYILLLGAGGEAEQAGFIAGRLATIDAETEATELAALLVADLELGGPGRLDPLVARYLFDGARSIAEIEAALLALSVQGGVDAAVPRARIVDVYRRFIRQRPALAGYVAIDLARWGEWDATADYVALLNADAIADPASDFAARSYVANSPDADARLALAR